MQTTWAEKFDEAHGGKSQRVQHNGWFYFSDGAVREVSPHGAAMEPSRDKRERLKTRLFYRQVCLEQAEEKFHRLKSDAIGSLRTKDQHGIVFGPNDSDRAAVEALRTLQRQIRGHRSVIRRFEKALHKGSPDNPSKRQQVNQHVAAENAKVEAEILQIKI